jgi:hypothetical protein
MATEIMKAERPCRHPLHRLRRHHPADRDAEDDEERARQRLRHRNGTAQQRRHRGEQHRAGEPAGWKLGGVERKSADSAEQEGFNEVVIFEAGGVGGLHARRSMPRRMRAVKFGARPVNLDAIDRAARRADFAGASTIFVQKIGSVAAPRATQWAAGAAEMDSNADLC